MLYRIIKDFKGSQDGRFTEEFHAGSEAELSDYLAGIVVPEGWAEPIGEQPAAEDTPAEPPVEQPAKAKKAKG